MKYHIYIIVVIILNLLIGCTETGNETKIEWEEDDNLHSSNIVLFLGDSLTAGYGLEKENAFPYLLQQKWQKQNIPYTARNAGISGATSADILHNLSWSFSSKDISIVFLCIGANDGLRGWDISESKKNIENIIVECQNKKLAIVLAGMRLPLNYGEEYRSQFSAMYKEIADKYNIKYMPFLLDGVAGVSSLNLQDGVHPNEKGHKIIADNIYQFFIKEKILP